MADHVVRYAHHVDLSGNELRNALAHHVTGLPTPVPERAGWIVYNSVNRRLFYCTGSAWELHATNADVLNGQAPAFYLNRANHSGQQLASTISDLHAAVTAVPLNEMAAPTGPLNAGNQQITNLAPATAVDHVPTWGQVADLVANLGFKHVRLASTTNVDIATTGNGATMDEVVLATNDLVLLKDQTNAVQNGIYRVAIASMARDPDNDTAEKMPSGTVVVVDQGASNSDRMWILSTSAGFVIGVDPITFSPFGVAPNPYNPGDGISIVSNTIAVVPAVGITVGPAGVGADFAVVSRYWDVDVPAPTSGTAVNLTHNLGRAPVPIACMELSTRDKIETGVNYPDNNNVIVDFSVAPVAGQYRVAVG